MANTAFVYQYRDASNYKKQGEVIFAGPHREEDVTRIREHLDAGEYFIPEQVDLPNPMTQFGGVGEDDHVWNEFLEVVTTGASPTDDEGRTWAEFVEQFCAVQWDPAEGNLLVVKLTSP